MSTDQTAGLTLDPLGERVDRVEEIVPTSGVESTRELARDSYTKEAGELRSGFETNAEIEFEAIAFLDPAPNTPQGSELRLVLNLSQDVDDPVSERLGSAQNITVQVRTSRAQRVRTTLIDSIDDPITRAALSDTSIRSQFDNIPGSFEFSGMEYGDLETRSFSTPFQAPVLPDIGVVNNTLDQLPEIEIDFNLRLEGNIRDAVNRFIGGAPGVTLTIDPEDLFIITSIDCQTLSSEILSYKEDLQELESQARVQGRDVAQSLRDRATTITERLEGARSPEDVVSGIFSNFSFESESARSVIENNIQEAEQQIQEARTRIQQLDNLQQRFEEFDGNWENFIPSFCLEDIRPEVEDAPYSQIRKFINGERAGPSASELRSELQTLVGFFSEIEGSLSSIELDTGCVFEEDVPRELRNEIAQFEEGVNNADQTSRRETLRSLVDEGEQALSDIQSTLGEENPCTGQARERVGSSLESARNLLDSSVAECVFERDVPSDIRSGIAQLQEDAERANSRDWTVDRVQRAMSDAEGLLEDARSSMETDNPCYDEAQSRIESIISDLERESELSCQDVSARLKQRVSNYEYEAEGLAGQVRSDVRERLDSRGSSLIEEIESSVQAENPCRQELVSRVESTRSEILRRRSVDIGDRPCGEKYSSIDNDIEEIENEVAAIPRASVNQGGEITFPNTQYTSVGQIMADIEDVASRASNEISDDTNCLREFTSRLNAVANDAEQLMLGVRVDQEAVQEIRERRQEVIGEARQRLSEIEGVSPVDS